MINKDGTYGSRATNKEIATLYGDDVIRQLEYIHEVVDYQWDLYVSMVVQSATIAAHHGRKSLKQK